MSLMPARYRIPWGWIAGVSVTLAAIGLGIFLFDVVGLIIRDAGRSTDPTPVSITVADVPMSIPANMLRNPGQRGGNRKNLDIFFHWSSLNGYTNETAEDFRRTDGNTPVIYVAMSGVSPTLPPAERLYRIYSKLFVGGVLPGPAGLVAQRVAEGHGYDGDLIYYQPDNDRPYVVRCSDDSSDALPSCMRQVRADARISVSYRFAKGLLPQWREIDAAVIALVQAFVATAG